MADRFILGWEEWLSLPDLGLPAIKAKVDTGARTSALHAFFVEPFGSACPAHGPLRRASHPRPRRREVICTAEVIDRREVTSSNGERENRYVIRSTVSMGDRTWPIDITLANRETMAYRMLLGRQAILDDMFVDATSSFRQPRLGYKVYGTRTRTAEDRRALRIALLTRQPDGASNRRLAARHRARAATASLVIDRTPRLAVRRFRAARHLRRRPCAASPSMPSSCAAARRSPLFTPPSSASSRCWAPARSTRPMPCCAPAIPLSHAPDPGPQRHPRPRDRRQPREQGTEPQRGPHSRRRPRPVRPRRPAALRHRRRSRGGRHGARRPHLAAASSPKAKAGASTRPAPPEPARHLAEDAARALHLGLASIDVIETRQGPVIADVTPTHPSRSSSASPAPPSLRPSLSRSSSRPVFPHPAFPRRARSERLHRRRSHASLLKPQ